MEIEENRSQDAKRKKGEGREEQLPSFNLVRSVKSAVSRKCKFPLCARNSKNSLSPLVKKIAVQRNQQHTKMYKE